MRYQLFILGAVVGGTIFSVFGNQQPTGNANPAYGSSNVQAQLRLNIREDAGVVHFIRDTNDPRIITKTYVLKHADPYSIRPYLREMVQAQRVDYNNPAGRANPDYYNVYGKENAAGSEEIFVPCGIECIKFNDGTGLLIVSAEDYRFSDRAVGMGIDQLVQVLDRPGIMNSSGQPKYIYFPANRSASELRSMIRLVGANVSNDTVELIGGKDKVEVDEELNCLFFNTALYSRKNISEMLRLYDVPHPEVRIRCIIYELNAEDDDMLGVDFQSWKNNDGIRFLQTGADFSRNYNIRDIVGAVDPSGTVNSHYFNFNPRWNTRFLDFLVSRGKAEVVAAASLTIQNGSTGVIRRSSGTMYAELTGIASTSGEPEHGNTVEVKPVNDQFNFELEITPSVTERATVLSIRVATRTLLGYASSGNIRGSDWESRQRIMLGNGRNRFYLGGIDKTLVVRDTGGIPWLKDLPVLGWIFSTERESVKKSRLIVAAECETLRPDSGVEPDTMRRIEIIRREASECDGRITCGHLANP